MSEYDCKNYSKKIVINDKSIYIYNIGDGGIGVNFRLDSNINSNFVIGDWFSLVELNDECVELINIQIIGVDMI